MQTLNDRISTPNPTSRLNDISIGKIKDITTNIYYENENPYMQISFIQNGIKVNIPKLDLSNMIINNEDEITYKDNEKLTSRRISHLTIPLVEVEVGDNKELFTIEYVDHEGE